MSMVKANQRLFERILYAISNNYVLNVADKAMLDRIFSECSSSGSLSPFMYRRAQEICQEVESELSPIDEVLSHHR